MSMLAECFMNFLGKGMVRPCILVPDQPHSMPFVLAHNCVGTAGWEQEKEGF